MGGYPWGDKRDAGPLKRRELSMTDLYSNAQSAADYIRAATDLTPHIGIILGSGLGNFANHVRGATRIPYAEIPHFPLSPLEGHSGHLVLGPGAGQRFFDMSTAYSPRLRALAVEEAARQGFQLPEGVYLAVLGPIFEAPAEIRAFRTLGAD